MRPFPVLGKARIEFVCCLVFWNFQTLFFRYVQNQTFFFRYVQNNIFFTCAAPIETQAVLPAPETQEEQKKKRPRTDNPRQTEQQEQPIETPNEQNDPQTQDIEQGETPKKPTKRGRNKPGDNRKLTAAEETKSDNLTKRSTNEFPLTKSQIRRWEREKKQEKKKK